MFCPELLELIFSYLDLQSIFQCRQICRQFLRLIDNSPALQYKIELKISNQEDHDPYSKAWSTSVRLEKLRQQQTAWRKFEWTKKTHIINTDDDRVLVWDLAGNVWGSYAVGTGFRFRRIPSLYRSVEEKDWNFTTDIAVADMCIDPCQDLLVVLERTSDPSLHLLSLATGALHPNAPSSTVSLASEINGPFWAEIRICGTAVGIILSDVNGIDTELHVLHWKTGTHRSTRPAMSHTFLNEELIMIPRRENDTELIAKLCLQVFDLSFRLVATFYLPDELHPFWISICSETRWSSSESVPFSTLRQDRLLAMAIYMGQAQQNVTIFVTVHSLLNLILTRDAPVVCPWSTWAEKTRIVSGESDCEWACVIHGMKFISLQGEKVTVRDFNQLAFKRDVELETADLGTRCCGPTAESRLCYREMTLPISASDTLGVVLNEDGIVLMKGAQSGGGEEFLSF